MSFAEMLGEPELDAKLEPKPEPNIKSEELAVVMMAEVLTTVTSTSYEVGPLTILRPGTRFRASGGPYFMRTNNTTGETRAEGMYEKGPFIFLRHVVSADGREWIEARNRCGNVCVLHLKSHPPLVPSIVNRPYVIKGTTSGKSKTTLKREKALSKSPKTLPIPAKLSHAMECFFGEE